MTRAFSYLRLTLMSAHERLSLSITYLIPYDMITSPSVIVIYVC